MPRRVIRVPHEHARHARVHANGHEAGHCEFGLGGGDVGNGGVAYDGNGEGEEHNDAAEFEAV